MLRAATRMMSVVPIWLALTFGADPSWDRTASRTGPLLRIRISFCTRVASARAAPESKSVSLLRLWSSSSARPSY